MRRPAGATAYDAPAGTNYWRREPAAYECGLLAHLPGGLTAPRCCTVEAEDADTVLLWLEDLSAHEHGEEWPVERYVDTARRLGTFGAAYAGQGKLPEYPWLSRTVARDWMAHGEGGLPWRRVPKRGTTLPCAAPFRCRSLNACSGHGTTATPSPPPSPGCRARSATSILPPRTCSRSVIWPEERTVAIAWEFTGIRALGEGCGHPRRLAGGPRHPTA